MTEQPFPSVAMIVLTWNQRDLTLDCLASLLRMGYPPDRLQIIVVDNGSADGTAEAIRRSFPAVTVIENEENLGFAEGNNVGIRHALQGPAEYIMLLNNDTIVDTRMLSELMTAMRARPDVGVVGPKIYYHEPSDVIWCAGNRIDWSSGKTTRLRAGERDTNQEERPETVDYVTGCALCIRRSVVEAIGLLDPRYFIYYEETDWCARARVAGWEILYVPSAHLWHRVSAAMGTASPATDYYMSRNILLFLAKNGRGLTRPASLIYAASRTLLATAAFTLKPHGGARLANRNAKLLGLRDALLGRWGKMPPSRD